MPGEIVEVSLIEMVIDSVVVIVEVVMTVTSEVVEEEEEVIFVSISVEGIVLVE